MSLAANALHQNAFIPDRFEMQPFQEGVHIIHINHTPHGNKGAPSGAYLAGRALFLELILHLRRIPALQGHFLVKVLACPPVSNTHHFARLQIFPDLVEIFRVFHSFPIDGGEHVVGLQAVSLRGRTRNNSGDQDSVSIRIVHSLRCFCVDIFHYNAKKHCRCLSIAGHENHLAHTVVATGAENHIDGGRQ